MIEPEPGPRSARPEPLVRPRRWDLRQRNLLADRDAVDPEQAAPAVVRLDQHADRPAADRRREPARRRPDPALELVADHAGPAADVALGDGAAAGRRQRSRDVLRAHVAAGDVVEPAVIGLARDRQAPVEGARVAATPTTTTTRASRTVPTALVFVIPIGPLSSPPRGSTRARSARRCRSVVAAPAKTGSAQVSPSCGTITVTPGAHRALADDERAVAVDERHVADADAGHVGDGVQRSRGPLPDRDAEVPGAASRSAQSAWVVETMSTSGIRAISSIACEMAPLCRPRTATSAW